MKWISELDDLIYRRSTLSTYEILEKLHNIDQNSLILPVRYYQNSIDVCAQRGDMDSAMLVLRLAGTLITPFVSLYLP